MQKQKVSLGHLGGFFAGAIRSIANKKNANLSRNVRTLLRCRFAKIAVAFSLLWPLAEAPSARTTKIGSVSIVSDVDEVPWLLAEAPSARTAKTGSVSIVSDVDEAPWLLAGAPSARTAKIGSVSTVSDVDEVPWPLAGAPSARTAKTGSVSIVSDVDEVPWLLVEAPSARTAKIGSVSIVSDVDEVPGPQVVILSENEQAWRAVLHELHDNLPAPAPQPGTFSDLIPRRQAACAPEQRVAVGDKNIPCWLLETVAQAADETGTDAVYLMALADKESSFRKDAKASTSSARGLFQFLDATWLELIRDFGPRHGLATEAAAIEMRDGSLAVVNRSMARRIMDLRENPYVSAVMAGEMLKRDQARVEQEVGRSLDRAEYYFTHFLGANSASRLLRAKDAEPAMSATGLLPRAARANRSLFTSKAGRKRRGITVAEFHQRIENMMEQRFDRYEEVDRFVVAQAQVPR